MRNPRADVRALAFAGALVLLAAPATAEPAGCGNGVSAAGEHVAFCVRSEKRHRAVRVRMGEGAQLSAEAGLEVFACDRGGRSCKSVKTLFGEGEYFPADFAFDFEGRAGHYRVEYGVCDKAQEVCLPGQVEFRLSDRR